MKNLFFFLIFLFFLIPESKTQNRDLRETFLAAESYFLFEEFNEALPLYMKIHRQDPKNDNINFKIGVCFLNNPYEKEKSIFYLEQAVKNINPDFKENNIREKQAPLEALFYLGNAYRINNQLDNAREQYNIFLTRLDPTVYDTTLVNEQIASCDAAESLMKKPIDYDASFLSEKINTRFADINPVVSGDETKMVFVSKLQFYDAIFYSEKVNGEWTQPRNIVPELGVDGDVYPTCLSFNGNEMFIYRNDDFVGNLYYTRFINGKWTALTKLNDNINTKYWESHASLSKDGKKLYFSSNRKGGYGGLDIYMSHKLKNGEWGVPVNLGPVVNSRYNDDTPFITGDNSKIFFSSYGNYNMGGYDIFMTMKDDNGEWGIPVNIGYPVNTTDDDQFFHPVQNGQAAYYARYIPNEGFGRHDILRYEIYSIDNPRKFLISGFVSFDDELIESSDIEISVFEKSMKDTLESTIPDSNGEFSFRVPAGEYDVVFDGDKFKKYILSLSVDENTPKEGLRIPETINLVSLPPKLTLEELSEMLKIREDSVIYVDSADPVKIRFTADRGNIAEIRVLNDSVVIDDREIEINRKRQNFEFIPGEGTNKVQITVKDDQGNEITKSVDVIYEKAPTEEDEASAEQEMEDIDAFLSEQPSETDESEDMSPGTPQPGLKDENIDDYLRELSSISAAVLLPLLNDPEIASQSANSTDLVDYLYENAANAGITDNELKTLFLDLAAKNKLDKFIRDLISVSDGNLKKTLTDRDLLPANAYLPRQLVDSLIVMAEKQNYNESDLVEALGKLASRGISDVDDFKDVLLSKSEASLNDFISNMSIDTSRIKTPAGLSVELYKNNPDPELKNKLLDILTDLAVKGNPELLRKKFAGSAYGDLKTLLDTLDLNANNILTEKDLLDFLYENKYALDYTDADVSELIMNNFIDEFSEAEDLRLRMAELAEGDLKNYLDNLDVYQEGISGRDELIDQLLEESHTRSWSPKDIFEILHQLEFDGNIDELIERLIQLASGGLKQALIDLKEGDSDLNTFDQLIDYLLSNTDNYNYTEQDAWNLIYRFFSDTSISADEKPLPESEEKPERKALNKSILWTIGVLTGLGLIILLFIIFKRRKKKK